MCPLTSDFTVVLRLSKISVLMGVYLGFVWCSAGVGIKMGNLVLDILKMCLYHAK